MDRKPPESWHPILADIAGFLARPPEAEFRDLVLAAYERFEGHAAAGVAYHL